MHDSLSYGWISVLWAGCIINQLCLSTDVDAFKEIARLSTHSILAVCGLEHPRPGLSSIPGITCSHHNNIKQHQKSSLMPSSCRECFYVYVKDVVNSVMLQKKKKTQKTPWFLEVCNNGLFIRCHSCEAVLGSEWINWHGNWNFQCHYFLSNINFMQILNCKVTIPEKWVMSKMKSI